MHVAQVLESRSSLSQTKWEFPKYKLGYSSNCPRQPPNLLRLSSTNPQSLYYNHKGRERFFFLMSVQFKCNWQRMMHQHRWAVSLVPQHLIIQHLAKIINQNTVIYFLDWTCVMPYSFPFCCNTKILFWNCASIILRNPCFHNAGIYTLST